MFYEGSKRLKNIERAFEIERESYERTIEFLKNELNSYALHNREGNDKLKEEIKKYNKMEETLAERNQDILVYEDELVELRNKLSELEGDQGVARLREVIAENERLTIRVAELERQLKSGKVGLNVRQKEEYKRLKQKEYQQKWLKKQKKAQKSTQKSAK